MDADEELSSALQTSLLQWKNSKPKFSVYEVARKTWYLGAWINHSGWYPDFQRRLYDRDEARFSGIIHESVRFVGPPGRLNGDLLHYTVRSFAEHQAKVEKYTQLSAQQLHWEGKRFWRPAMLLGTPWRFFHTFILRGGFLDGHRGVLIAWMAARSVRLKYAKLGKLIKAKKLERGRIEFVKILFVDLEPEWRGGQNQALLLMKSLNARGDTAELVTVRGSALGKRSIAKRVRVHFVRRYACRLFAALKISELTQTRLVRRGTCQRTARSDVRMAGQGSISARHS